MVGGVDGAGLLKALIAGKAGCLPAPDSDSGGVVASRKITDFFLAFGNHRLNLSIFAKGERNNRQSYTTSLDGYTELRQKGLN
jgi:hypothetical protein